MKKVLIVYGLLVAVILLFVFLRFRGIDLFPNFGNDTSASVTINEQTFDVEVADNDEKKIKGLSDRDSLDRDKGMLFIFEEKGRHGFWMKNVNFPLDLIYISDNTIVDIIKNAQPVAGDATNVEVYTPQDDANYVLEINGGLSDEYGFEIGNEVVYTDIN